MRATAPGVLSSGPGAEFDALFTEAGGVDRAPFNGQNFDNVILCYLTAVAAGSTEGAEMAAVLRDVTNAPGDQYTWQELPEAIEALQNGDDIDYQGVSGDIELNDAGDPESGVFGVYTFKGDVMEPTSEVDFGGTGGGGAAE